MNENNPTVSVIIPTFNRAHLIGRAIRSVLSQTYRDFELIVVDDASTDETEEVVRSFHDPRIRYIRHKRNKGGAAARNTGIRNSRGKYIGLLDDDDEWLPQKLAKQIQRFQQLPEKYGVVYSGFAYVSKNGKILSVIPPRVRGYVHEQILMETTVGSPTLLIKKSCFEKAGLFDEQLPSCQDWDMWIRISRYCYFDYVPDILAKYYVHGTQISSNLKAQITGHEMILKKYWSELSKRPWALSVHLRELGKLYIFAKSYRRGIKYLIEATKKNPRMRRNYLYLSLFLLPPLFWKFILKHMSKSML